MRALILLFLVTLVNPGLRGQSAEEKVARMKQEQQERQELTEQQERQELMDDPAVGEESFSGKWDLQVGAAYSFMKGYGSGMMYYAAPGYILPLNDRWALHGGMILTGYQGLNLVSSGEEQLPTTLSSIALYAAASYRMSDRLQLHGAGVKQLITSPVPLFNPYPMDNLSLGATYRIGTNLTIGASIQMRKGPYYGYPVRGTGFNAPLHW